MKFSIIYLITALTAATTAYSPPAINADPIEANRLQARQLPPRPNANGYQFYHQTTGALVWAVLGVSDVARRTAALQFDIAATSQVLIAEVRNAARDYGSKTVSNVAISATWKALWDAQTQTVGLIVDATGLGDAAISVFEWAQFQNYVEQYFKATGNGFSTIETADVLGLIQGPLKRRDLDGKELDARADFCHSSDMSVIGSMTPQIASLPSHSTSC